MDTKHTAKLPVRIYHYNIKNDEYWRINDKNNERMAICKDAESAATILLCCNSHEALVAVLKAVKASVIVNNDCSVSYAIDGNIRNLIEQALKLAGEE